MKMLTQLVSLGPDVRVTSADLGAMCDVPAGNVATIISRLSRAGVLACTPGRTGGCSLARDPAAISTLEVIEALEGPLAASVCLLDGTHCADNTPRCVMHPSWVATRQAMIDSFATTSLADVVAAGGGALGETG